MWYFTAPRAVRVAPNVAVLANAKLRGARLRRRPSMEDTHVACDTLTTPAGYETRWTPISLYAVYDGHAGGDASMFCKRNLHRHVATQLARSIAVRRADVDAVLGTRDQNCCVPTLQELVAAVRAAFTSTDASYLQSSSSDAGELCTCMP